MPTVDELLVRIDADMSGFTAELRKVEELSVRSSNHISSQFDRISASSDNLAARLLLVRDAAVQAGGASGFVRLEQSMTAAASQLVAAANQAGAAAGRLQELQSAAMGSGAEVSRLEAALRAAKDASSLATSIGVMAEAVWKYGKVVRAAAASQGLLNAVLAACRT